MGVDTYFRTERIKIAYEYYDTEDYVDKFLSRRFCTFVSGFNVVGEGCEFNQIQKLFDMDLSPLLLENYTDMDSAISMDEYDLQEMLNEAKTEEEKKKIEKELEEERIRITKQEEEENKKWNDIDEFEELIIEFKNKLLINNDLAQKLKFYYLDEDYFLLENSKDKDSLFYDLNKILKFIAFAKSKGEQKFAFYVM